MMSSSVLSALVILSLVLSVDLRRSRSRSGRGDKDFSEVIKADGSGLFIWRIEDFSPVPLPEPQYTVFQIYFLKSGYIFSMYFSPRYGVFHNADSYIVLLNQIVDGRFHRGQQR